MKKQYYLKHRESEEWTNTWIDHVDDINEQKILMIGDCTLRKMRGIFKNLLENKKIDFIGTSLLYDEPNFWNVFHFFFSNNPGKYSTIFVNLGTHAEYWNTYSNTTEAENFKKLFDEFICYLRKVCQEVIILYIIPQVLRDNVTESNFEYNKEICLRNQIYQEIADKYNLKTIDLYSHIINDSETFKYKDHVHFEDDNSYYYLTQYVLDTLRQYKNVKPLKPIDDTNIQDEPVLSDKDINSDKIQIYQFCNKSTLNKKPLISIITTTYNLLKNGRKEYIIQNLESVHNQKYKNFEHIIIDGASNDGTLELLKPYAEKGWVKIYSEPDNGIYDAMNKGLYRAKGKYITYLNSDDFYHDEKGLAAVAKTLKTEKYDFTYSICSFIDENGNDIGSFTPVPENFYMRMPFCHQTLFVDTTLMKTMGGFDCAHYKSACDYDFVVRLYMRGAYGTDFDYNFVTFRRGGFSITEPDISNNECVKLLEKHYTKLLPAGMTWDFNKFFFDSQVPEVLFNNIKATVCAETRWLMDEFWHNKPYFSDGVKLVYKIPHLEQETIHNKKILGLNLKVKTNSRSKKYYFLGLPLFAIKQNNKLEKKYYFMSRPVFTISQTV